MAGAARWRLVMPRPAAMPPCASPVCVPLRARHVPACESDLSSVDCPGCLPRLAADGLRLCARCADLVAEDPATLVVRFRDLGRVLTGGSGTGERVTASRDPNVKLNQAAVDARHEIRAELVGLVRLIVEERGVSLPTLSRVAVRPDGFIGPMPLQRFADSSLPALGRFVARHGEWLAAHRSAGEFAAGLRDLVRETYSVAFPSGLRMFPVTLPRPRGVPGRAPVAPCPERVRRRVAFAVDRWGHASEVLGLVACAGSLWSVIRPRDDRLPAELLCSEVEWWPGHRWPTSSWLRLGPRLLEAIRLSAAGAGVAADEVPAVAAVSGAGVDLGSVTKRLPAGDGFVLVCCACGGQVVEAVWGVPSAALVSAWERHVCAGVSMVEGGVAA